MSKQAKNEAIDHTSHLPTLLHDSEATIRDWFLAVRRHLPVRTLAFKMQQLGIKKPS